MKTAAQELLAWLNEMPKVPISRDLLVSKILICIEEEKKQIVGSFNAGRNTYLEPNLDGCGFYDIQYDDLKTEFKHIENVFKGFGHNIEIIKKL